ncbi:MAG: permease, partial [Chloroflexi bacterium]
DYPTAGDYQIAVHGTDHGHFAVGAMLYGMGEPPVLGGVGATATAEPIITTVEGEISRESDLFYTISVHRADEPPRMSFDAQRTMMAAINRLGTAMSERGGVLGATPVADDRLRRAVMGDEAAVHAMMTAPADQRRQMINSLIELCQTLIGDEYERALAIVRALEMVRDAE